ncbi:MAG: ribosomal protein S19 family protein [Candidatus Nanoarchaeia archaeon]
MEVKKKDFTFRGKTLEELNLLDVREFAKYLKSRGRRATLRQFNEIEKFIARANKKISKNKLIKTHSRDLVVVPKMVGMKIHIHTGKTFEPIEITGNMLGHRLGEFALTRQRIKHGSAGVGATKGSKFKSKK